jgi:hypothetical protein
VCPVIDAGNLRRPAARLKGMTGGGKRTIGILTQVLAGAWLLLAQVSGPPGSSALDALERAVKQPMPQAPAAPVHRSPDVWVPDRYVSDPVRGGTVHVPAHWERRLSDREYYAPPTTVCSSARGECSTIPAGVRPPPETRQ